jgi:thiamine-phosphate diphosphorylase
MLPRLHAITDDRVLAQPELLPRAIHLVERFGVAIAIHVRGRATPTHQLFEIALELARVRPAAVFVNDRVDLALACHTAGVQLRHDSLPIAVARDLLGARWLGFSAHSAEEARAAADEGADFIIAGTIYASASHTGKGQGLGFLAEVVRASTAPVVAIGGIDAARARECRRAGAYGVAVIRAVWDAPNPVAAVHDLLGALNEAES